MGRDVTRSLNFLCVRATAELSVAIGESADLCRFVAFDALRGAPFALSVSALRTNDCGAAVGGGLRSSMTYVRTFVILSAVGNSSFPMNKYIL